MGVISTLLSEMVEENDEKVEETVEECDIKCLRARRPVCRCRCGGRNHGYLMKKENARLDDYEYVLYLSHVDEVASIFEGKQCPNCGSRLDDAEILGYEHVEGLYVERFRLKLWIFAHCPDCHSDVSWRKVVR